jgi:hypothetical protein
MNKQEFMAMSLPYGLKCFYSPFDEPDTIINFDPARYIMLLSWAYDYKPILHPLPDLTKPIEHNGEKFVPIVKLAQIMYPNHEWELSSSGLYASVGNGYMTFEYDYGYNCFLCDNSSQLDQLECLLKTISWHFDIADLIEKCEAIDVNTLETNPYK